MDKVDPPDEGTSLSTGTLKSHHIILIAAAVIIIVGLAYYAKQRDTSEPAPPERIAVVPEGSRAVTLYFAHRDEETLITETRMVGIGKEYVDQIGQVLRALLNGPQEGGVSTIADGTGLLDVFYDSDSAILYVDFTSEIVAGHPGGSSAEYFTIAAIMRTVSQNFPEVRAVQFLVEGFQVGTLAGHIDAYKPFAVSDWR